MKFQWLLVVSLFLNTSAALAYVRGFTLVDDSSVSYKANLDAKTEAEKTSAQKAVDHIKRLGGTHVVLTPKATMSGPRSNSVVDSTPDYYRPQRAKNYLDLIRYIKSQGMTVGIRPVFFVVCKDSNNRDVFPCIERNADKISYWWHGNIQPENPFLWFESFQTYLNTYLTIARQAQVEEFTVGAELYSMTVGIEDQWKEQPHGFPCEWLKIVERAKRALPKARIMYDATFTDDTATPGDSGRLGGELERWRYRLVDLAPTEDVSNVNICETNAAYDPVKTWKAFATLWNSLDQVGIDMYRSLATKNDSAVLPSTQEGLTGFLKVKTDQYAEQLNNLLTDIQITIDDFNRASGRETSTKQVIFKEIGFKSKNMGFLNPEEYDDPSNIANITHQAAAYDAFLRSFWAPRWDWFNGVVFWDIDATLTRQGANDPGFTPLGKPATEKIIQRYFMEP